MLCVNFVGILCFEFGRFYCGDEVPAVVTALCTKTQEFIVASIPVATINQNGRESSHRATQAFERCEGGNYV